MIYRSTLFLTFSLPTIQPTCGRCPLFVRAMIANAPIAARTQVTTNVGLAPSPLQYPELGKRDEGDRVACGDCLDMFTDVDQPMRRAQARDQP